jgi:hypothetical protein
MTQQRGSNNNTFITLIDAAERYQDLAHTLLAITRQPVTERKIRVLDLTQKSRGEVAPADVVSALLYLGDNESPEKYRTIS